MAGMSGSTSGLTGQHVDDDLDFVVEAFGKQRTQRTVDQARGEGFLFGGFAFAFEEPAGDLAGRVRLFDVIHGQGKEILASLAPSAATTVASTTVSSMVTTTAPPA